MRKGRRPFVAQMKETGMETVRWGIIGCGYVAGKKSGPALQRAGGSALVAVMRGLAHAIFLITCAARERESYLRCIKHPNSVK